jgi:TRAP-type uncharacterized transport system substrate-binding protein
MKHSFVFRKRSLWLYPPLFLLSGLLMWLSVSVWLPLPPQAIVMAGGLPTGTYIGLAVRYRDLLEERGIRMQTVTTKSSSEPLQLLQDPKSGVDAAFAQGLLAKPEMDNVMALATVQRSPVWVFTRVQDVTELSQLKGFRIGTSTTGNSGWEVTQLLLQHAQLKPSEVTLSTVNSNPEGAQALIDNQIDALVLVSGGESESIRQLTRATGIWLVGIDRVTSLIAREPRLKPFVIPQGAIELRGDLPPRDLTMVAADLHLLVTTDMHPALQRAMLEAAREIHEMPSFLQRQGEFPNSKDVDFYLSPVAQAFANGERPWLERVLPYWWAQLAQLIIYALLPILLVTVLALVWIPNLFNWKINAVLQNFYGELKFLETDIEPTASSRPIEIKNLLQRLDDIEAKVTALDLPNSHANRWYTLREHLARARGKLLSMRAR